MGRHIYHGDLTAHLCCGQLATCHPLSGTKLCGTTTLAGAGVFAGLFALCSYGMTLIRIDSNMTELTKEGSAIGSPMKPLTKIWPAPCPW